MSFYTAINPQPIAKAVHEAVKRKFPDNNGLVPVEDYHITMVYIGDSVDEASVPLLASVLDKAGFQYTNIYIRDTSVFRNDGTNYLVAQIANYSTLKHNVMWQEGVLCRADIPVPTRRFTYTPHITLLKTQDEIADWRLHEFGEAIIGLNFLAKGFELHQAEGRTHRVLHSFEF